MPFVSPPPSKPAETIVWVSQPSPDDIARAEGFFSPTNVKTAKAAMTCYVLADGRLDACRIDDTAPVDHRYDSAMLSLAEKYRLDRAASSPRTQVTVGVTFPKLQDVDQQAISRPTPEEMRAALTGADDVVINLHCKVARSGALEDCSAHGKKEDARFEAAALGLAGKFRFQPLTLNGRPTEGYASVTVASSSHLLVNPDWERKPNGDELASVYPRVAAASGLGGQARMRCLVQADGVLTDCMILTETPSGVGFGDALLKMASKFRMRPKTLDGKPVSGAEVVIPVNFLAPQGAKKVDTSTPGYFKILPWAPWVEAPTAAEVAAAFPKRARDAKTFGNAALRCDLKRDGRLVACESTIEGSDPMGFGRAALSLASKFRANVQGLKPSDFNLFKVAIPVSFSPRALEPDGRYVRQPEWLRAPDAQSVVHAYPDKAIKAGVLSGKAVVDCRIGVTGSLEGCSAKSEEPSGLDFGASAEKVASIMQANLWTRDGEAAAGQRVLLPLRFIYTPPAGGPEKDAPAPKPGG